MTHSLVLVIALAGNSLAPGDCPGAGFPGGNSACNGGDYRGPCPGDLDGDGLVDELDVAIWQAAMGSDDPCSRADLDGDRDVDLDDLGILLGPCVPANIEPIYGCQDLTASGVTYVLQVPVFDPTCPPEDDICFRITDNNITLDGNHQVIYGGTCNQILVDAQGLENVVIRNLKAASFSTGIRFVNTDNSLIEDNEIWMQLPGEPPPLAQWAITLQDSDGNTIRGNYIYGATYAGIDVVSADDNRIRCNELEDSGGGSFAFGASIRLRDSSAHNTIADNCMSGDGISSMPAGVLTSDTDDTCVIGNEVFDANGDSYDIRGSDNWVEDNLADNTNASGDTITIRTATNSTFKNNFIRCGGNGYYLISAYDTVIMGGSVEGVTGAAIKVGPLADPPATQKTTITGVAISGSPAYDLGIEKPVDDFRLIDTAIGNYFIDTDASGVGYATALTVEDSLHGIIAFQDVVNGCGSNFNLDPDGAVLISDNRACVNSLAQPGLDSPARVTLYGLPFLYPRILKDGVECFEPDCTMLLYFGGTAVFDVTSWSCYSIDEDDPFAEP